MLALTRVLLYSVHTHFFFSTLYKRFDNSTVPIIPLADIVNHKRNLTMSDTKMLKKITIKDVCELKGKTTDETKSHFKKLAESESEICAIAGEVTGYGAKATQFGESIFLMGNFIAQNRETRQVYESTKCYLPKDITENIVAAFKNRPEESEYVEFKTIVRVVPDPSSGYTYICVPIQSPETMSRKAKMMQSLLSLPAPEKPKQKKTA